MLQFTDEHIKEFIIEKPINNTNVENIMNEIDALYYVEFDEPIWWKQTPCYYCDDESINIHTFDRQNGLKHFLIVLCHELAHHLQYLAGNTFEYLLESFENVEGEIISGTFNLIFLNGMAVEGKFSAPLTFPDS